MLFSSETNIGRIGSFFLHQTEFYRRLELFVPKRIQRLFLLQREFLHRLTLSVVEFDHPLLAPLT